MQKQTVIIMAIICIVFGLLGMSISFLAVLSSHQVEIIGVGLGFIAASILIGMGLITIAIVSK